MDEHQRDPPAIHVGAEGFEGAVAFTTVEVGAELDRGPDIAGDVVEQIDRGAKINGGAMLVPDPARYGKAGLGGGELARYSANHLGADTACFLRLLRGERRERAAKRVGIGRIPAPLAQQHVRHCEHDRCVCAGLGRVPLVRVHPGERHARSEGDMLRHVPIVVAMGLGESTLVLQR